jgi:DNA (cytosine-5)-methyltransferase 1
MSMREKYVKVREAAAILGVCPNTVRAWGAAGRISEYRHPVNAYRLYRKSDLEKLVAQVEKSRVQPIRRPAKPK